LVNLPIGANLKQINTVTRTLNKPVTIDKKVITEISFDLQHINFGWDKVNRDYNPGPARQNYTEADVISFFEQLNTLTQTPTSQTSTKGGTDKRYAFNVYDEDKKLKMVVDLMFSGDTVVVTIH